MSDWQVGDLAVCTPFFNDNLWADCTTGKNPIYGPNPGEVYRVTWCGVDWDGVYSLSFPEFGKERFDACEFRKIRPDEREACEPEFVTLLKRSKRKVRA